MTEPVDLSALRALAEKATPGPWVADCRDSMNPENDPDKGDSVTAFLGWDVDPLVQAERGLLANGHDAAYIAAVSPDRVLALLSEVESLRAALRGADGMLPPERVELLREPTHDAMTRARAATEPTEREAGL